jgi:amino acid transporter
VLALIVFFILAIIISAGGIGPRAIGFEYWHDPGAFADSINGVAKTFVVAGTLYAGTEMYVSQYRGWRDMARANSQIRVGITAGESANPQKAVPKAIRQVFWRILIFYVGKFMSRQKTEALLNYTQELSSSLECSFHGMTTDCWASRRRQPALP